MNMCFFPVYIGITQNFSFRRFSSLRPCQCAMCAIVGGGGVVVVVVIMADDGLCYSTSLKVITVVFVIVIVVIVVSLLALSLLSSL